MSESQKVRKSEKHKVRKTESQIVRNTDNDFFFIGRYIRIRVKQIAKKEFKKNILSKDGVYDFK